MQMMPSMYWLPTLGVENNVAIVNPFYTDFQYNDKTRYNAIWMERIEFLAQDETNNDS